MDVEREHQDCRDAVTVSMGETLRGSQWLRGRRFFAVVDSTNRVAKEALHRDPAIAPALFWSRDQTAGRGRQGRTWISSRGSLTFSLAVGAKDLPENRLNWPLAALVVGLAVCDGVEEVAPALQTKLKWPNDVYLNERKLAGVLIESTSNPSQGLVIGVGVNVCNDLKTADREVRQRAIAIHAKANCSPIHQDELVSNTLTAIVTHIERRLLSWQRSPATLIDDYRNRCLLTGREIELTQCQHLLRGICRGINGNGELMIEDAGEKTAVRTGEIRGWSSIPSNGGCDEA